MQRNESDEDRKRDEQNLDGRRQRQAEARTVFENLFEQRRVTRVGMLFSFGRESSQSDVAVCAIAAKAFKKLI